MPFPYNKNKLNKKILYIVIPIGVFIFLMSLVILNKNIIFSSKYNNIESIAEGSNVEIIV
jgi:hypothetical protein